MTELNQTRRQMIAAGSAIMSVPLISCSREEHYSGFFRSAEIRVNITDFGLARGVKVELKLTLAKQPTGSGMCALSEDGSYLAAGYEDGKILIFNLANGTVSHTLVGHKVGITGVEFAKNGELLAASSFDGAVKLWDISSASVVYSWGEGVLSGSAGSTFSPNGKLLLISSMGSIPETRDTQTGELIAVYGEKPRTCGARFSPDGETVVTGAEWQAVTRDVQAKTSCRIWDAKTGSIIQELESPDYDACGPSFSRDGNGVVARNELGDHLVWDAKTGARLASFRGPGFVDMPFDWDPDCKTLIGSSENGKIGWVYDFEKRAQIATLETPFSFGPMISSNGKFVLTRPYPRKNNRRFRYLSDVDSGKLLARIEIPQTGFTQTILSNDSKTLITSHESGEIYVWAVAV